MNSHPFLEESFMKESTLKLLTIILLLTIFLTGCNHQKMQEDSTNDGIVLHLLTEQNMQVFNKQIIHARQEFEKKYKNVDILKKDK